MGTARSEIESLPRIFKGRQNAPDTTKTVVLYRSHVPISVETFQGLHLLTKKRELFQGLLPSSPSSFALPLCSEWNNKSPIFRFEFRNINPIPFRITIQKYLLSMYTNVKIIHSEHISPTSQDRLTHVQLLFTWNPSPHQSSKFSFDYLLLPPWSAQMTAPPDLTIVASMLSSRPPTCNYIRCK